jgi:hypothetical protein
MLDNLLSNARKRAERSDPPVRIAALMRIARVQSKRDAGQARITFEMALAEIGRLSPRERGIFLDQARLLSAAICPELFPELSSSQERKEYLLRPFPSGDLIRIMIEHQHYDAAFAFARTTEEHAAFPFALVGNLIPRLKDEDSRLELLHRVVAAWRTSRGGDRSADRAEDPDEGFFRLFASQWKLLPKTEAAKILREIVRKVLDRPEHRMTAKHDEGTLVFTSSREKTLFQLWHVIRHLDAPLAEFLLARHKQLAAAAGRFPWGMETIHEEAEEQGKRFSGHISNNGGLTRNGDSKDSPYLKSLIQASKDGDFERSFQYALDHYWEDTEPKNPNSAPKELWPSANSFRAVLYRAGIRLGEDGAKYLHRIPDPDLRLLAEIEFAAALAGLPELAGPQRFAACRKVRSSR